MKYNGIPVIKPNVMSFPSNDDTALHNLDTDQYALLVGPVASWIWSHINSLDSTETIAAKVCSHFEADESEAMKDLDEFLGLLVQHGFISIRQTKELEQEGGST